MPRQGWGVTVPPYHLRCHKNVLVDFDSTAITNWDSFSEGATHVHLVRIESKAGPPLGLAQRSEALA